jgi:hypothetical protein
MSLRKIIGFSTIKVKRKHKAPDEIIQEMPPKAGISACFKQQKQRQNLERSASSNKINDKT